MREHPTFYDVLEVAPTASPETIAAAYRSLCKRFHPDVYPDRAAAETRMKAINEAHAVLTDASQRARYDAELAQRVRPVAGNDTSPVFIPRYEPRIGLVGAFIRILMVVSAVAGAWIAVQYWSLQPHTADALAAVQRFERAADHYVQAARAQRVDLKATVFVHPTEGATLPESSRPLQAPRTELVRALAGLRSAENRKLAQEKLNAAITKYQLESLTRGGWSKMREWNVGNGAAFSQRAWTIRDAETEWLWIAAYAITGAFVGVLVACFVGMLTRTALDLLRSLLAG